MESVGRHEDELRKPKNPNFAVKGRDDPKLRPRITADKKKGKQSHTVTSDGIGATHQHPLPSSYATSGKATPLSGREISQINVQKVQTTSSIDLQLQRLKAMPNALQLAVQEYKKAVAQALKLKSAPEERTKALNAARQTFDNEILKIHKSFPQEELNKILTKNKNLSDLFLSSGAPLDEKQKKRFNANFNNTLASIRQTVASKGVDSEAALQIFGQMRQNCWTLADYLSSETLLRIADGGYDRASNKSTLDQLLPDSNLKLSRECIAAMKGLEDTWLEFESIQKTIATIEGFEEASKAHAKSEKNCWIAFCVTWITILGGFISLILMAYYASVGIDEAKTAELMRQYLEK